MAESDRVCIFETTDSGFPLPLPKILSYGKVTSQPSQFHRATALGASYYSSFPTRLVFQCQPIFPLLSS